MPLMDEFKEEREEIKNASFKKKADYFWEYYKWWVIGGAFLLIIIITTVYSFATRKKDVLYVALINGIEYTASDTEGTLSTPFLIEHGFNPKKERILFDADFQMNISSSSHFKANTLPENLKDNVSITNSASARQNLSIYIAAASVDIMICSENWFDEYGYGSFFSELSTVFTEEELEKYSDYIYYIDGAVMDRYADASHKTDYDYFEVFPDSYDIEAMERPIAVGLIVDDSNLVSTHFAFGTEAISDKIVIGILANSQNKALSHDLIVTMMNQ